MEQQGDKIILKRKRSNLWLIILSVIAFLMLFIGFYFYTLVEENKEGIESGEIDLDIINTIASTDDPYLGGENAQIVIVEFGDFYCPYCAKMYPIVKQVAELYGDQIKIIYRDFPTANAHKEASEAGACAHEQGKFWEMHDKLFLSQDDLSTEALKRYAVELELDAVQFSSCLDSGKYEAEVDRDFADGFFNGAEGTPTFFINNRKFEGMSTLDDFKSTIDELLVLINS